MAKLKEFICIRTCHVAGKLWKEGDIVTEEKAPNKHWELLSTYEEKKKEAKKVVDPYNNPQPEAQAFSQLHRPGLVTGGMASSMHGGQRITSMREWKVEGAK